MASESSHPGSKPYRLTLPDRLAKFFRRVKEAMAAKQLPRVARKTCEIYLEGTDPTLQARCRRLLQTQLSLNPKQLRRFFQTTMGESFLDWVGRFIHGPAHLDDKQVLEQFLMQMAADPDGWSLLSALRHCPETLQFNLDHLLFTAKRVDWLIAATRAITNTVCELSRLEAQHPASDSLVIGPIWEQAGPWAVQRSPVSLPGRRQGRDSEAARRPITAVCYRPDPWPPVPVPVIVQSHGLASSPEDVERYARYLASYGYFVVAPQHPGSDVQQVRHLLAGETTEVFKLSDFIDRPLDISYLLDELGEVGHDAQRSWAGKLNLQQVGIMGYSFGAYTAFALAGATIHFERLERACGLPTREPNLSLLLQCQALALPRQLYHLQDPRIQAILSLDSVGSSVFGTAGLAQIQVPVMLVAGSHDTVAPLILEQIRIFQGLTVAPQYLALIPGKSHLRDIHHFIDALNLKLDWSLREVPTGGRDTAADAAIQALSVAFFSRYLQPAPLEIGDAVRSHTPPTPPPPDAVWLMSQHSKAALDQALLDLDRLRIAEYSPEQESR